MPGLEGLTLQLDKVGRTVIPDYPGEYKVIHISMDYDLPNIGGAGGMTHFHEDKNYLVAFYSNGRRYLYLYNWNLYAN